MIARRRWGADGPTAPTGLARNSWALTWTAPSNTSNVHSTTGAMSVTLTHSWRKQW